MEIERVLITYYSALRNLFEMVGDDICLPILDERDEIWDGQIEKGKPVYWGIDPEDWVYSADHICASIQIEDLVFLSVRDNGENFSLVFDINKIHSPEVA